MRNIILFIAILLNAVFLFAESTVTSIQNEMDAIKNQPSIYFYGYAEGADRDQANQRALQELLGQISVLVISNIQVSNTESTDKQCQARSDESIKASIDTYSYGRLPGVSQLDYRKGSTFHIFRYIEKTKYNQIFEYKKNEIGGFLREAELCLNNNELGNAFRNYYRSALAIESLPECSFNYNNKTIDSGILFHSIQDIARKIDFKVVSNDFNVDTRIIILSAEYNSQPVNGLTIQVYDLTGYIPFTTNDGMIQVDLIGQQFKKMENLDVKIDVRESYADSYEDQTSRLAELFNHESMEVVKTISLSSKNNANKEKKEKAEAKEMIVTSPPDILKILPIVTKNLSQLPNCKIQNPANCPTECQAAAMNNIDKLFTQFADQQVTDATLFTDNNAYQRAIALCRENRLKLAKMPQECAINKTDVGYELRPLSVTVQCAGLPTRNESLVVDFDSQGRIYNLTYTINPATFIRFQNQSMSNGDWDSREVGIKFLENYKTAFTTKDLKAVTDLFTEDALIITGKVVQHVPSNIEMKSLIGSDATYLKQTKQQYIENLRRCFATNKTVWLQYDTFDIQQASVGKVYGMAMKQNYYSTTYKDEGYLFLLVDFRGEKPLIHVRVWQPGEWDLAKMVNTEYFTLH